LYDTSPTMVPPVAYRLRDHPRRPHQSPTWCDEGAGPPLLV